MNFLYFYIVTNPQAYSNSWLFLQAKNLSKKCQVVYYYPFSFTKQEANQHRGQSIVRFFVNLQHASFILFPFIQTRMTTLVIALIRMYAFVVGKKIVLLFTNEATDDVKRIAKKLHPSLVLFDLTDYWDEYQILEPQQLNPTYLINSEPIKREVSKRGIHYRDISAGYYLKKSLLQIHKKSLGRKKVNAVICITTVSWRLDMKLLQYLIDSLPTTEFHFYAKEIFSFNPTLSEDLKKRDLEVAKTWDVIKRQSNVFVHTASTHESLAKKNIIRGVGIIPYDMTHAFNSFCHPTKAYDYLALGMPIVSNTLSSLSHIPKAYISFADSKKTYKEAIVKYLKTTISRTDRRKMVDISLLHTHEQKTDDIRRITEECLS